MGGGSPSLRRRRLMVTWTVLVNGSAFSSQARARRSSALRTAGAAFRRVSSTANSLTETSTWRPSRVTVRRSGSSSIPAARRMRGRSAGLRRARARMRSTGSGKWKGLGRYRRRPGPGGDPVAGGAGGGKHEDHDRVAGRGDRAADRVAVDAGQVPVQDEYIVGIEVQLDGGVRAVVGDIGGDALITQALGDVVGQPPDILRDQDPHRALPAMTRCAGRPVRSAAGKSITACRPPSGGRAGAASRRGGRDRLGDRQSQAGSGR